MNNDFLDVLDVFDDNSMGESQFPKIETEDSQTSNEDNNNDIAPGKPFDTQEFVSELQQISSEKNKDRMKNSSSINGYAVGSECIGETVMKILNYPVESYAHKWLPIVFRAFLGNAVHDFIQQNTNQFTEQERSIKVPSIRFSGRIDGLISYNCLTEIKSCTYQDYSWIIKNQKPRFGDFYQLMTYRYIIENYLNEIQNCNVSTRSKRPELNQYNIDTIQFIYVAHDLFSSDLESIGECLDRVKYVKKLLNSKNNQFFFIKSVVLDLSSIDTSPYDNYIAKKIERINYYVDNNELPNADDPFINTKSCYFCMYKPSCPIS